MQSLSGRWRGGGGSLPRGPRNVWVQAQDVVSITRVVSDLRRAESFYRMLLQFSGISSGRADPDLLRALGSAREASEVKLRLGAEEVVLVQLEPATVGYPADSRSDDLWFQHLAIVVSDMDTAYSRLRSSPGWQPISADGPQTLPASSGGVRAFKFRDPDGHPLELLWFPPRHGDARWQERARAARWDKPFLGIDHTALAVSCTRRSLAFYRSLGWSIAKKTVNFGPAQSRLDDLPAAHLRVTGLRPVGEAGPGLELLAYEPPGRARKSGGLKDSPLQWTTLAAAMAGSSSDAAPLKRSTAVSDPDGHRFVLVNALA